MSKFINLIKNYIGFIGVILVAAIYFFWGFLTLKESGKSIQDIFVDSAITLSLGLSITYLLRVQGIVWGMMSDIVTSVLEAFGGAIKNARPQFKNGVKFARLKNKEALEDVRRQLLDRVGLEYDKYFVNGKFTGAFLRYVKENTKDEKAFIKLQNQAIKDCLHTKITNLSWQDIISDNGRLNDPNYLGGDIKQFMFWTSVKNVLSSLVLTIVFSYYTYELFQNFRWEDLYWKAMQVLTFTVLGFVTLYFSYMFITTEYRSRKVKQINLLEELVERHKEFE
jgi:ABC-type transporter Mla maintaining outer membrane lipid asymmetry permease subunit MlaE